MRKFKEYAVKILKTLIEIQDGKQVEYQGYIYTIYSIVRSNTEHPGIMLMQILENTDLLITGLKNLNSNIKHYIDELTRHKTVAEIMDVLFNDYITNIVDKAYHRLLTSDNVSKFRPEIVERLESKGRNKSFVGKASAELAEIKEVSVEVAEELVYQYIHDIVAVFQSMDDILEEIKRKNTQYQKAAINRAKFLLTGSEDIRGQLKEILVGIGEEMNCQSMDIGGIYRIDFLEELVRLYSVSVIDEKSLYSPIEGKKEFKPEQLELEEPDEALRQQKLLHMMEKMQRVMNPQKIDDYILEQMGERTSVCASELPIITVEDFVKIIYTRLYGQRKHMSYRIEGLDEKVVNGYCFKDFRILRKE